MALHWAWACGICGEEQNYGDSGWAYETAAFFKPNFTFTTAPPPRQPLAGYGGMNKGIRANGGYFWTTPVWPQGALTDGVIQLHFYVLQGNTNARIRLLNAADVILLELRLIAPTSTSNNFTFEVFSSEGGTATSRGTLTTYVNANSWHTLAIRFKPGTSGGYISVSLDGHVDNLVVNGNVGATSPWAKLKWDWVGGFYSYVTGISVWDSAADAALTTPYWIPSLRPVADSNIGSWTDQASGTSNLYATVDEDPISTADYCTTTTDPDEIRFTVETDNIDANWAPATIEGVSVIGSMRGDGVLNTGQPVIDDGSNNLLGTSQTTDAETSAGVNDVFPLQADASTPWTKAALETHSFGVRAS